MNEVARLALADLIERAMSLCEVRRVRIPDRIRDELYLKQAKRCTDCGERLVLSDAHADHIVPRAHGGSDEPSNLQLLHSWCNLRKGARDPIDHARTMGRLL